MLSSWPGGHGIGTPPAASTCAGADAVPLHATHISTPITSASKRYGSRRRVIVLPPNDPPVTSQGRACSFGRCLASVKFPTSWLPSSSDHVRGEADAAAGGPDRARYDGRSVRACAERHGRADGRHGASDTLRPRSTGRAHAAGHLRDGRSVSAHVRAAIAGHARRVRRRLPSAQGPFRPGHWRCRPVPHDRWTRR